jgi:hypothetical protein
MSSSTTASLIDSTIQSIDISDLSESVQERVFNLLEEPNLYPNVTDRKQTRKSRWHTDAPPLSIYGRTHRAMERQLKREIGKSTNLATVSEAMPHTASEWPEQDLIDQFAKEYGF